jgi:hypothetical protein
MVCLLCVHVRFYEQNVGVVQLSAPAGLYPKCSNVADVQEERVMRVRRLWFINIRLPRAGASDDAAESLLQVHAPAHATMSAHRTFNPCMAMTCQYVQQF